MRFISCFLFCSLFIVFPGFAKAEIGWCKEKTGYVKRESLITAYGPDCNDNELNGLCSILLSAPKIVEDREFRLFTYLRKSNGQIKACLNIAPEYYEDYARIGLEFEEASAEEITIHVVYQNIAGCTLQSQLNLGELVQKSK